jgi:hypothetical protein
VVALLAAAVLLLAGALETLPHSLDQLGGRRDAPELPADRVDDTSLELKLAAANGALLQVDPHQVHLFLAQLPVRVVVEPAEGVFATEAIDGALPRWRMQG